MTRMEWQDKLSQQFGQLGNKLMQLGANNRNVFIPDYEVIVPKILDLILDTNLAEDTNSAYKIVTVVDDEHRVAAEVRTTLTNAAIQQTLDLFSQCKLHNKYGRLVILVMSYELRVNRDKFEKPFFRPRDDLWNLQTLFEKVSELDDANKAERISGYLDQMLAVSFNRPKHYLDSPPPSTDAFVGREQELYTLRRMLCAKKPIFISGMGGIGKTELALRMAEVFAPPKGAYFIRYENNDPHEHNVMRQVILNANFFGYRYNGQDNDARDREYAQRLEIFKSEYQDSLLIIDNLDLNEKSIQDICCEEAFRDLVSSGIYLVFTTRHGSSEYIASESLVIDRLSNKYLIELMRSFLRGMTISDDSLISLIKSVNGHTQTVELMARTISKSWGRITPDTFRDIFTETKLMDPRKYPVVPTQRNGMYLRKDIYSHLRTVFYVSNLSEMDQRILRYASLLPVNGMDRELFYNAVIACEAEHFRGIDETGRENIINSIPARGWLRRENDILIIHPVLRIVCHGELEPTDENCAGFLDELWLKYNTPEYNSDNFHQLAELFMMAAKIIEDREGICSLRAGLFWHRLGMLQKALDCYQETVRRQQNSKTNEVDLVRTYNKIGRAYLDLGKLQKAHESFHKALEMAKKNPTGDQAVLAATYANIGRTFGDLGDYEKALECRLEALRIKERFYPADHPSLAASYSNVGSIYFDLGNYTTALEYNMKALDIREKNSLSDDDLNLATSYNNVGGIYMRLNDHKKALEYLQKALTIREEILPSRHPALATSYNNVGVLCMLTEKNAEALEHLLNALEIREQVLSPEHPDLAETCNNIALTYYAMEQYESALVYIKRAITIAETALSPNHPNQAIYRTAMDAILKRINK